MSKKALLKGCSVLAMGFVVHVAYALPTAEENAAVVKEIQNMKAKLPQTIDSSTKLVDILLEKGSNIVYKFDIVSADADKVDATAFLKIMKDNLKGSICKNESILPLLGAGYTLVYRYDINNDTTKDKALGDIEINQGDCPKATTATTTKK